MTQRILALLAALSVTACSGVPIGPVDHRCHTAGMESMNGESGCSDWGAQGRGSMVARLDHEGTSDLGKPS
jgi:hypothetical protein